MHKPIFVYSTENSHLAIEKFSQVVKRYKLHRDSNTVYSNDVYRGEIMKDGTNFVVLLEKWEQILDSEVEKLTIQLRLRNYCKNSFPDLEISRNQAN